MNEISIHNEIIANSDKSLVTILMLHGWGRSVEDLKPLASLLSHHATIHLLDLPGFGKTQAPPIEGWSTKEYADLVISYIRSNNLNNIILLGHSFGGRVSLRITAEHPELVKKLILIDSHGLKPIRTLYQNIRVSLIKKIAKLVKFIDSTFSTKFYQEKFAKKFGSADYQKAGILKNTFVKTISEDQTESVKKILTETLLIWGELDTETPLVLGRKFKELLQNSKLIVLEGKDHSPHLGVGAHLCANYIIEFIG